MHKNRGYRRDLRKEKSLKQGGFVTVLPYATGMISAMLVVVVLLSAANAGTAGSPDMQTLPPGAASVSACQVRGSGKDGPCCAGISFAGRQDLGPSCSLLGGNVELLAPDDRICREDLCAQRDGGYDDKNTATGGTAHKDWSGIGRDTAYFVGYQIAVIGLLYVLPESVTGWTKEQKKSYDFDEWVKNVKSPVWDKDKLYLNYLVHPYWGATYYIRARERGFDKFESFVYSAFLSALFEYGAEALFEAPSYQDLIVTPIAGTLLGMYVFEPIRERIKAKGDQQEWYDTLALVLSDPLGAVSELTDNLFGIKSSANLVNSPAGKSRCRHDEGNLADSHRVAKSTSCRNSYMGLEVRVQW